PITGDTYVAMTRGPVPSELYDILKYNRGDELLFVPPAELLPLIKNLKVILPYYVKAESEPNLDYLSASSIEMLEWSVAQHGDKSFDALTTESHDVAYDKASENADISYKDMAEAENVSDEMKAYIALNIENAQSLHAHAGLNR
ncbi:MAG: Panacea domain-containing protein, partial [Bacteroidota bacterium]|nr:Panacea domain-containing protein [Bacteroidota bacterium]